MKRDDYVFSIGFDGSTAIVDKRSRSRHKGKNAQQLADDGQFKAAYRMTVFDHDVKAADDVLAAFNAVSPVKYAQSSDLAKVFGVQPPSDGITSSRAV
ncbi:MAG: hypothetical protein MI717_08700 [Spirochaetales bacterium]|nr:hypothetical protein [Spirochaetales bacterium]